MMNRTGSDRWPRQHIIQYISYIIYSLENYVKKGSTAASPRSPPSAYNHLYFPIIHLPLKHLVKHLVFFSMQFTNYRYTRLYFVLPMIYLVHSPILCYILLHYTIESFPFFLYFKPLNHPFR